MPLLLFCPSDLQEDVPTKAERTAEAVREAGEKAEGAEGRWQVHQAGGKVFLGSSWDESSFREKRERTDPGEPACISGTNMKVWASLFPSSLQEKQTKEALTRKQQKCRRKNQDEESQETPELLKRPKEYTVRFTFPNPPPLSPPVLGLHGEPLQLSGTGWSVGTPALLSRARMWGRGLQGN